MSSPVSPAASVGVDARWMRLALSLGRRGMGRVWPNPAVGCVLVKDGRVIGRGWTQDGGRPHAETMALGQAGAASKGATAYVTLEPCAHSGQTPPCCDALIAAGVTRVVAAIEDPDARVAGRGLSNLRAAGIEVASGVLEEDARCDHAGFLSRVQTGRPFVTLKLATSIDGRIATASGESQWITGPDARRSVHAMRARHDAVMIGSGTARHDTPSLTVRGLGIDHQPVRIVLSNTLDLPQTGPLYETAKTVPVWIIHGSGANAATIEAWQNAGARLFAVAGDRIDVGDALSVLGQEGLTRIFCEGGGQLAASLLRAGQVDQLIQFSAGMALGANGMPALGDLGVDRLADVPRFKLRSIQQVGDDVLQRWTKT